jgi:hypothetical protein
MGKKEEMKNIKINIIFIMPVLKVCMSNERGLSIYSLTICH